MAAILSAVLKLVHYTTSLPLEKPQPATRRQSYLIFDPTSHSTKQLLHFQCTIYHMMGGVLGGVGLAQKVSTYSYIHTVAVEMHAGCALVHWCGPPRSSPICLLLEAVLKWRTLSSSESQVEFPPGVKWWDRWTHVQSLCCCLPRRLLEALLSASTVVGGASPTEELVGRYLGSLHRKVQKVVGKVTGLLSLQSFLDLVGQLIAGSSPLVQHQALGLLAQELQSVRETFGSGHVRRVSVQITSLQAAV